MLPLRSIAKVFLPVYSFSNLVFPLGLERVAEANQFNYGASGNASVNCDSFCAEFGQPPNPAGLTSNTWSATDDQLCAQLGSPTVSNNFDPGGTYSPDPTYTAAACNGVTLTTQDINAIKQFSKSYYKDPNPSQDQYCTLLGGVKDHCSYHNSQVEQYCMAYNSVGNSKWDQGGAYAMDSFLLAMDAAVAGTCAAGCAFPLSPAVLACEVGDAIAAVAELVESAVLASNPMAIYISDNVEALSTGSAVVAGVGGVAGIAGIEAAKAARVTAEKALADAQAKLAQKLANQPGIGKKVLNFIKSAFGFGSNPGKTIAQLTQDVDDAKEAAQKATKAQQLAACATATVFATLFGLRAANISAQRKTADSACNAVNNLLSNGSPTPSPSSSGSGSGSGGGNGADAASTQAATSGTTTGTGSGGGAAAAAAACTQQTGNASGCAQQAGLGTSNATDSGLVNSGNLGTATQNIPSNPAALASQAASQGAGAALAGTLPAALDGTAIAGALTGLAQVAQDNAADLAGIANLGTYSGGGGSGGISRGLTGITKPDTSSLFGHLFSGGAGASGAGTINFAAPVGKQEDIWHSGTELSIFQIISRKLGAKKFGK